MLLLALGLAFASFVVVLALLALLLAPRVRALASVIALRLRLLLPRIRALVTARRRRVAAAVLDKTTALVTARAPLPLGPYRTPIPPVRRPPARPCATSVPGPGVAILTGLVLVASCTLAQDAAWKRIGSAIEKNCLTLPKARQALDDLVAEAGKPGATAQGVAENVALTDGLDEAVCAASQFVAGAGDLFAEDLARNAVASAGPVQPGPKPEPQVAARKLAYKAARHLVEHADEVRQRVRARSMLGHGLQ